jgi:hypothetical protein
MKLIKGTSILAFSIIIIFVNFNKETPLWDLFYYNQSYLFVAFFIILGWKLEQSTLVRSIIIAIGFYYLFELSIDVLRVFSSSLVEKWYTTKVINYILAISCGLSLLIYPFVKRLKK